MIAGTGSGVGKTSVALGLARALARRGLGVATFKVGPDFLDPTYLTRASARPCYNLDGWMTGRNYVCDLFARATANADVAIIEGVMGLFDGASATELAGSTAEVAAWLDAPVLLVVSAHGAARSLAATVHGFAAFEPSVRIAGVIANHAGGDSHRSTLAQALAAGPGPAALQRTGRLAALPPLLGCIRRGALPALPSRHLGLVTADADALPEATIDQLADACEKHLDIGRILELASPRQTSPEASAGCAETDSACDSAVPFDPACRFAIPSTSGPVRIGVARDTAFHFYYPDNFELLRAAGAELVEFSPLNDSDLPADLGGLYLGGGYPEVHAERLSANRAMLDAVRGFAASGRCIYAECGGLIYLARSVRTLDGRAHRLAGVLPIDAAMLDRLSALGYVEVCAAGAGPFGGGALRGHEFHYSAIIADDSAAAGWRPAWSLRRRRSPGEQQPEGWTRDNVLASYVHLHFASRPDCAARFVRHCEAGP